MNTKATYRLISWNILEGFLAPADGAGFRTHHDDRLEAAQSLIAELRPDILVLNEALHCEAAHGRLIDYTILFGMKHGAGHVYEGAWGNAILSNHQLGDHRAQNIHHFGSPQNRSALACDLHLPDGDIVVATLHPHPHRSPANRAGDFRKLLATLDGPFLLAGDFNAINPADKIDAGKLVQAFEAFSPAGKAEASAMRMIEAGRLLFGDVLPEFGLTDLLADQPGQHTIPTRLIADDLASAMRIDHVLGSPAIRRVSGGPVHDPRADIASDHYPVLVDFIVEPSAADS